MKNLCTKIKVLELVVEKQQNMIEDKDYLLCAAESYTNKL